MAAFATMSAAETRAYTKVKDGTWINAHAQRNFTGVISVRVQREMTPTAPSNGAWVVLTDDAAV